MHPFVFTLLFIFSFSTMLFIGASKSLMGFSIDLIARHSPMSPLYNSQLTQTELVKSAAMRSMARSIRVDFIGQISPSPSPPSPSPPLLSPPSSSPPSSPSSSSVESIITPVPDHGEYLMRFSLGTPGVERLAIFDTGSDLSWVQCTPCKTCYPQEAPLFDPTQSSTYVDVPCDSQPCTIIPENQRDCGNIRQCIYLHQYGENSVTIGKLGQDTITFGSTGMAQQSASFPKSVFGCAFYTNFTFEISAKSSGMVGLGPGPLSLASQLGPQIGNKFSYCMVPFSSTSTGKLKFGNQMAPSNGVVSTPFFINPSLPSYYFLNLEGITVGTKKVLTSQTGGNIIIDSVPILTHLEQGLYTNFMSSVKEAINVEVAEDAPTPFEFCLRNPTNMNFPEFVFHFTGADVVLSPKHMFIALDSNLVCMTVVPSHGVSIFGNWAQVDFQVEYDLGGKKVSFAPTNCSTI
ncbi:hypothetical protein VNO78_13186 [Psophocarpus tetragonolobus]|uniref:Peptidase A1 domain-containing protein n=1 Tax=Psophocarpus tetragonolobus TaxID=3891 RepID=A0AAN9SNY0_PSOTE